MAIYLGSTEITPSMLEGVSAIYLGSKLVWQAGLAAGTTFDFSYTGTVQSVELPKGKYWLQCWGAQGGTSYGSSSGTGSKGGYSEGVLTLTEKTTLYIFVGGQGSRGSSTSLVNGGWNGGGASVGYASYSSGGTSGYSYPACGGGATDISTVTSNMSYSSGRTNRSSASLLARCIVAGGGAGGSYRYTSSSSTSTSWVSQGSLTAGSSADNGTGDGKWYTIYQFPSVSTGTFKVTWSSTSNFSYVSYQVKLKSNYTLISNSTISNGGSFTINTSSYPTSTYIHILAAISPAGSNAAPYINDGVLYKQESTSSSSSGSSYSTANKQGGGTSGGGTYPGTQSAGGNGNGDDGGFGYGGNQTTTGYRYVSGGAGGGWYGGGTAYSDSSTSYINYTGGGSGFVNTSANSSYRPSGYTGLELDSGTTTAGSSSHPSTSGGTETGHSGNGYARITVLDKDGTVPETPSTSSISWDVQSGTWNSSSSSSAADGLSWTCVSPGTSGSTVIRCTFSGVSSITFNCVYSGESNYDYLTVGSLDTSCTRSSYGTTLKGTSGTAKDITFTCDTGEHYVEFCYSKDSSVDTSPDNATVYVKSYS